MTSHPIPVVNQNVAETVWEGMVPPPAPGALRILVLEAEIYATDRRIGEGALTGLRNEFFPDHVDPLTGQAGFRNLGYRIAFADAIELP